MNKRQKDACTVQESGINYFGRVHYSGKQPEYQAWDINTDWDKRYFITGICNTQVPKLPLLSPSQSSISAILSVPSGPQTLCPAPRDSCCGHMLSNSLAARSQPTSHCHKAMQLHAELANTQQTAVPALSPHYWAHRIPRTPQQVAPGRAEIPLRWKRHFYSPDATGSIL